MLPPIALITLRLFLRLFLGLLLFSVGISKLVHPGRFHRGILDYKVIPPALETRFRISTILSFSIPVGELLAGSGLLSGLLLVPAAILTFVLFVSFSWAMIINLRRGRRDLACHCGGAIGDHFISWWLVGRNGILMIGLVVLLFTPTDTLTVGTLSAVSALMWTNTVLPVVLLVGMILVVLVLFNAARALFHS